MKKRKIIISVLLVFFIAAAGVGSYFVHSQRTRAAVSNQEIVLEEGQELLYAKITSISGNEMDYTVLEAQTIDLEEMGNGRNGRDQDAGGRSSDGDMPSGNQNRNMADSTTPSDDQNRKSSRETSNADAQNRTMTTYTETEKTGQIQIPVGTDVETKLGTITTFSRLSNGDTIRMLMQKSDNGGEDLLKIWIVE